MASYSSATKALQCAITMQRAFTEHNEETEEPIKVRIGLNAGEPIAEDKPVRYGGERGGQDNRGGQRQRDTRVERRQGAG